VGYQRHAPGASTAKCESCAFLTQHPDRQAHWVKEFSCLIWRYSRADTINSTQERAGAGWDTIGMRRVPLRQKCKSCAFSTQHLYRQAHWVKEFSCLIWRYSRADTINSTQERAGAVWDTIGMRRVDVQVCFFDTTPVQTSTLGERKKTFSCLIWRYSQANTINSTLAVITAVPSPGTCSTAKCKCWAFLTQYLDRQAR